MWRLSSICTDRYDADDLKKPHICIKVVKRWCKIRTDPVLRCFMNLEGLNYVNLLVFVVMEFLSWLTV
jgi:hypothetical protein